LLGRKGYKSHLEKKKHCSNKKLAPEEKGERAKIRRRPSKKEGGDLSRRESLGT